MALRRSFIAAAVLMSFTAATPALADGWSLFGWGKKKPGTSSSTSGGATSSTSSTSSGGATPVPEPATIGLFGLGVAALAARRRRRA